MNGLRNIRKTPSRLSGQSGHRRILDVFKRLIGFRRAVMRNKSRRSVGRPLPPRPHFDENLPKNGPLVLAVLGSVLIMAVLGTLNARLIKDPSVSSKAFGPSVSGKSEARWSDPATCAAPPDVEGRAADQPPQVTFYKRLRQDDQPTPPRAGNPPGEQSQDNSVPKSQGAILDQQRGQPGRRASSQAENISEAARSKLSGQVPEKPVVPHHAAGKKNYTVQVGVFSQPAIAKQWAEKWRARGFNVFLKPVARPKSGVIYRLYLGSFPTEEKAEELVRRLKAKEGISAFCVTL